MNRYYVAGIVCLILAGAFLFAALPSQEDDPLAESTPSSSVVQKSEPLSLPVTEKPQYESPIDFPALQAENPDVYAWLSIKDTEIDYPVLRNTEDSQFYIDHNSAREPSSAGALFTESEYNSATFDDPVTIIYGHKTTTGTYFGNLQAIYSDSDSFAAHSSITVYLPDKELHYTVFAAVPYDKRHILYNYNFQNSRMYRAFLDSVYSVRAVDANFSENTTVSEDDKLLILSTCLKGDSSRRYLVLAKLDNDHVSNGN